MDMFVVPTISFRLLYGLPIMGHGRRQVLWFGVTAHPTAEWIANQVTEACGWEQDPRHLIRDRDGMALIVRDLGYRCDTDGDWAEALTSQASGDAYCWPLGAKFHNLNCYANFGIALNGGATSEQRKQEIDKLIKETSAFMSKVPFDAWQISPGDAAHTLRLAKGRWALDMGQTIEPYALA